jgi:hypothetical protein
MPFLRLAAILLASGLLGCASNPPVQPAATSTSQFQGAVYAGESVQLEKSAPGTTVYRAFYQGGTGFVSISSVRETVEEMATRHCARSGKAARPLKETASNPPYILGNFPRIEWLFDCVEPVTGQAGAASTSDRLGQLERLKKLLDSGALSQQEYDREKAKILGAP